MAVMKRAMFFVGACNRAFLSLVASYLRLSPRSYSERLKSLRVFPLFGDLVTDNNYLHLL
ncbi:hypothetical protein [Legionella sp. WA2024007413]